MNKVTGLKNSKSYYTSPIIRAIFTIFMLILIPTYWVIYGPQNFLWLSDVGLFLTFLTLWFASSLINSICMIAIFPIELTWYIDFFMQCVTGYNLFGTTDYMFNPQFSLFVRALSLFHLIVPTMWIWYLYKWGYDKHALKYALPLVPFILILTYMFTTNVWENTNWVFTPLFYKWVQIYPIAWLAFMCIVFPLCIVLPMHFILKTLCSQLD